MTENDGHFPDPETLTEDEKINLIHELHEQLHRVMDAYNAQVEHLTALGWGMGEISLQMVKADRFGIRARVLRAVASKLATLSAVTYMAVGISPEDVKDAVDFASIVQGLEDDPDFNPGGANA